MKLGSRTGNRALVVYLRTFSAVEDSESTAVGVGGADSSRAGIVVGKRQISKATTRNNVKRRLRHLIADRIGALPSGSRMVVRALGPTAERSSAELGALLDQMIARVLRQEERRAHIAATEPTKEGEANG